MEQRPLRLGDVVDDYCPRERRVTNHAIVAIVEDVIRQTRCTACETEHSYKGAREPRLRRKPGTEGLYEQVLADVSGGAPAGPGARRPDSDNGRARDRHAALTMLEPRRARRRSKSRRPRRGSRTAS